MQSKALRTSRILVEFAGLGLLLTLGKRQALFDPHSGQLWERVTVLGWTLYQQRASARKPLRIEGPAYRPSRYPASVAALAMWDEHPSNAEPACTQAASEMLAATLLALACQEAVQIDTCVVTQTYGAAQRVEFAMRAGRSAAGALWSGEVERRIVQAVEAWAAKYESAITHHSSTVVRPLRHLLTIHDLTLLLLGQDSPNPGRQYIERIVGPDAVQYGIGQMSGRWVKNFVIDAQDRAALHADCQSLRAMYEGFQAAQPEQFAALRQAVQTAFRQRIDSGS